MASPVPKDAATTSSFTIETSFAPNERKAIMRAAPKILRFIEAFDQRTHCFKTSIFYIDFGE